MDNTAAVNLYLVGFAGSGKSTVGRQVARELGLEFIDSDHAIETAQGRPVTEIFAEQGEPAFRALEREFVERGHPARGCVVACGGGLIVPEGVLELLQARGVVVCLHASVETILARTARTTHRPLFQGEDKEARVRALFEQREAVYRRAGTMILTDHRVLRDIVSHVERVYRHESQDWASRHA